MRKSVLLMVLVTLIDLLTAWPFQGPQLRALDVVIAVALLWALLKPDRPARKASYFGLGERVQLVAGPLVQRATGDDSFIYGTVIGANPRTGLVLVRIHGCEKEEVSWKRERYMAPDELEKVLIWVNYPA